MLRILISSEDIVVIERERYRCNGIGHEHNLHQFIKCR